MHETTDLMSIRLVAPTMGGGGETSKHQLCGQWSGNHFELQQILLWGGCGELLSSARIHDQRTALHIAEESASNSDLYSLHGPLCFCVFARSLQSHKILHDSFTAIHTRNFTNKHAVMAGIHTFA
jgi:hypothetical protein